MKRFASLLGVLALVLVGLLAAVPSHAASGNGRGTASADASPIDPASIPRPPFDPKTRWSEPWYCDLNIPADVEGFYVVCNGGTFLDFFVSDGFIPGDHWELKGKNWDTAPNTGVTTSQGGVIAYSVPGRAHTYGGTFVNAYVECSYIHGINTFPASSILYFASDAGACTVTPYPLVTRINRTP